MHGRYRRWNSIILLVLYLRGKDKIASHCLSFPNSILKTKLLGDTLHESRDPGTEACLFGSGTLLLTIKEKSQTQKDHL